MRRRSFLATPITAAALPAFSASPLEAAQGGSQVVAVGDGIPHSPAEYANLLEKLSSGTETDDYSLGGIVAKLEEKMAAVLGKEFAVWMPTGTLANHLAVRLLAGEKRRVLVQQESHLYNDCGDCCQILSGLNLVPLAQGRATFTLEDVRREAEHGASGRVAAPIGAIQIETPVRRRTGEAFDFGEMKRISAWARERGIGLHLDGARAFLASAYSGIPVRQYAALFDTVYISLYKYFNAGSGAILAGPRRLLENSFQTRRMFGGGLCHVWPFAAVALHYTDGFEARYAKAVAVSEQVIAGLEGDSRFAVSRVPHGTNIFYLRVKDTNAGAYRQHALEAGITLAGSGGENFTVQVNETWNRATPAEILARLRRALV
ncbi:MAG TPA: beta-eliminating lyase-related protein [Bryobacteraceae bacterium]|jgi:threonine aldolase